MPSYDAPEIIWKGEAVSNNSEKSKIYKAGPIRVGRDESHYFIEVTLLVEDTLFRVPRCYFEQESDVFRDMFQLPIAKGTTPDGCSDEQPLRLDGILKEDFRQLLRVTFPRHMHILAEEAALSLAEWTSVLKLSAMWQMDRLRKIVVEKMSKLTATVTAEEWMAVLDMSVLHQLSDARALAIERLSRPGNIAGVDKILLARKHKIESWLWVGYQELVMRDRCFSDEEEDRLGWKTVSKLYRVRDRYFRYSEGIRAHIGKAFEGELREMGWSGLTADLPERSAPQRRLRFSQFHSVIL